VLVAHANRGRCGDVELERLLRGVAGAGVDRVERTAQSQQPYSETTKAYADLQDYLIEQGITIPLNERVQKAGVSSHVHGFAFRIDGGERRPLELGPREPTVRATLRAFVRMLRDGTPPEVSLDEGAWAVAMAEACYRSAASGCAEKILTG